MRHLIATAVGVVSPAVRAAADWLIRQTGSIDSILEAGLSNPDRLKAVHDTGLLEGARKAQVERVAQLTAAALGTPFASVTLVLSDRQILVGCNVGESDYPRERTLDMSLSKYVVVSGEPLIVNDAAMHPLLADHPAVTTGVLRSYAGIPLVDSGGNAVGTLSTWDRDRHQWTNGEIQILNDFAEVAGAYVFAASHGGPR